MGRVGSLGGWKLTARLEVPAGSTPGYDPGQAWTLVAGGDIMLDRGVSLAITGAKAGADFPFNGGTVAITGHCKNCSPFGWDLPYTKRTGNVGVVRELTRGADIAIANFENPAPDNWHWHGKGMVFSANPKNIAGLVDAGIDWVSLANNHIGDAGKAGIVSTEANLDDYGIKHAGAGKNTADAHTAALLKAGGVTVGILGYDTIAGYYASGPSTPGSAKMTKAFLQKDIAAARKAGADVVVVFPHWGVEYRAKPTAGQRNLAHLAIDAGADLVIGNHPHWAEGMEVYKGKPIWYALGNFVFDQTWSEPTMEGITLEMTFRGTSLVQVAHAPAPDHGQGAAQLHGPDGQRQGGHGPGVGSLEGAARLVGCTAGPRTRAGSAAAAPGGISREGCAADAAAPGGISPSRMGPAPGPRGPPAGPSPGPAPARGTRGARTPPGTRSRARRPRRTARTGSRRRSA